MEPLVWSDQLATGEAVVDREHEELVRIINWVADLHSRGDADPDKVRQTLDELVDYAIHHFIHEEELMASADCDPRHLALHQSIHDDFARQVTAMREVNLGSDDAESLLRFLTSWLSYHILGMDQSMTRQIRAIREGATPEEAYLREARFAADPATAGLLAALNSLYGVIAARNQALTELNRQLEQHIAERTQELSDANARLVTEHQELKAALAAVETTQKRLVALERQRSQESRRHMELVLAQIVDGDPVPTLVIDADHRVTHWNQACALVTGTPAASMVGTSRQWSAFYREERPILADLVVSGDMERLQKLYPGSCRPSPVIPEAWEAEGFFSRFGDGGRWLQFTAAPLKDAEGQIIGAIETLQDVTERRRAEEDLRRHQAQLEALVKERTKELSSAKEQLLQSEKLASIGQLAAGVAHEINNPIGYVHSNIGTLETYLGELFEVLSAFESAEPAIASPEARERLEAARRAVDVAFLKEDIPLLMQESREGISRVKKIVQDLKDFSRVDSSQEWQYANLHQGIDSTLNIVNNEIKYKADVVKEYGEIPEIECLPSQLNQVFMNLLVNSAHAMGDERGRITIRTGGAGGHVWLEFADNGSGIPEHIRHRIFDPFFTTKPVGKGTGLGLALSYGIIQNHHGSIEVDSEVGQGTTFRITLPVRQGDAPASQP